MAKNTKTAAQKYEKAASETRLVTYSFDKVLEIGEQLTGTPTITEETTTDLTLSNKVVSTAALTILEKTVGIGRAVQFLVAGGSAGTYGIQIIGVSDASPAQTIYQYLKLDVVADVSTS